MTRNEAIKYLPIIQAFADGSAVQVQLCDGGQWIDCDSPAFMDAEYRIKPQPREFWIYAETETTAIDEKPDCPELFIHVREVIE